jgi:signal transduction histidine kinase
MLLIFSPTVFATYGSTLRVVLESLRPLTLPLILFAYMKLFLPKLPAFKYLICAVLFILGSIILILCGWGLVSVINSNLIDLDILYSHIIASSFIVGMEALASIIIIKKKIRPRIEISLEMQILALIGFLIMNVLFIVSKEMLAWIATENWRHLQDFYIISIILVALMGLAILIILNALRNKHEKVVNLELESHYREMEKNSLITFDELYDELRKLRHDFHNHILVLNTIADKHKVQDLKEYVNSLGETHQRTSAVTQTGNIAFDSVLNAKIFYAQKKGIDIKLNAKLPERLPLNETEIISLIGNLLDNAIEACKRVKQETEGAPVHVSVDISYHGEGDIGIKIENSAPPPKLIKGHYVTSKDARKHGFGMAQIDSIVARYGGRVYRDFADCVFTTTILIPLRNEDE